MYKIYRVKDTGANIILDTEQVKEMYRINTEIVFFKNIDNCKEWKKSPSKGIDTLYDYVVYSSGDDELVGESISKYYSKEELDVCISNYPYAVYESCDEVVPSEDCLFSFEKNLVFNCDPRKILCGTYFLEVEEVEEVEYIGTSSGRYRDDETIDLVIEPYYRIDIFKSKDGRYYKTKDIFRQNRLSQIQGEISKEEIKDKYGIEV